MSWWNEITLVEQILYIIAAASTIILLIQTVFYMIGIDHDDEHPDRAETGFFSIRGILSFLSIGAWAAIVAYKATSSYWLAFCIGGAAGLLTMFLTARCFQRAAKLQKDHEVDLKAVIGGSGDVYLTIPPRGEGKGKVSIVMQDGKIRVFNAIAYEDNKISTGKTVRIADVLESELLLVERIQTEKK